ncbi:MAG: hypothetical protein ACE5HX_11090, partial [bacterium]
MKPITSPDNFPAARNHIYLNAANVALMYRGALQAMLDWQTDVAENGIINFYEAAEATVFEE